MFLFTLWGSVRNTGQSSKGSNIDKNVQRFHSVLDTYMILQVAEMMIETVFMVLTIKLVFSTNINQMAPFAFQIMPLKLSVNMHDYPVVKSHVSVKIFI